MKSLLSKIYVLLLCLCVFSLVGCDCAEGDPVTAFGPDCGDSSQGDDSPNGKGTGTLVISDQGAGTVRKIVSSSTAEGPVSTDLPLSGSTTRISRPQYLSMMASTDELIVVDQGSSSILFFKDIAALEGNAAPSRYLEGAETEMVAPVQAHVLAKTDELYVLDRASNQVLVYENASTLDGPRAPIRKIGGGNSGILNPEAFILAPESERMFIINPTEILTFENFAQLNGDPTPVGRVSGGNTTFSKLSYGMFDSAGTLILGDNGTKSLLFFENFNPEQNNIAPSRTVSGTNTGIQNPGQFLLSGADGLYISNGTEILYFDKINEAEGNPFPTRRITPTNPASTGLRGLLLLDTPRSQKEPEL